MTAPLDLQIALRYLLRRQGSGFLTLIATISVLGIAVGVMALLIALGLMTGLQSELRSRILGATAHVSIFKSRGEPFADGEAITVASKAATLPGVEGAASALYGMALVTSPASQKVLTIKGIGGQEGRVTDLPKQVIEGSIDELPSTRDRLPGILIGREAATSLAVGPGDVVTFTIPRGRLTPFGMQPVLAKFRVAGIVRTGLFQFDDGWAWMQLLEADRLLSPSGSGNVMVEVRLKDMFAVGPARDTIASALGSEYVTSDWIETNRSLFEALRLEKLAIGLTIALIVIVAALNIVATLILMVSEKRRSIAVLISMGAEPGLIRRIFVWQGLILGACGTLAGTVLGLAACFVLDRYKLIRIPADVYQVAYLPFHVTRADTIAVVLGALLIALFATLYPSARAASLHPVDSLRAE